MGPSNVLITDLIVQSLPSPKGCLYCGEPPDHTTVWSGYYWPVISNFTVRFLPRTFEKLVKVWKNLFLSNIASWGPTGSKNTKISIVAIFFQNFQNFQNFRFLYQPWTIHFCNKNFDFFFFKKIRQNLPDFNDFSECYKKKCSSQNCSRLRPHMVMLFKNWKLAKIRQISSIFHKKIENFEFNFCTYHERSNFGIKISHFFFFVLKILPTFCDYLPFFTTILKES